VAKPAPQDKRQRIGDTFPAPSLALGGPRCEEIAPVCGHHNQPVAASFPPVLEVRSGLSSARDDSVTTLGQARAVSLPPALDVRSGLNSACVASCHDDNPSGKRARRTSTPTRPITKHCTAVPCCDILVDPSTHTTHNGGPNSQYHEVILVEPFTQLTHCAVHIHNSKKRRTIVVESQPTHSTTTIGKCGGEPDPLDYKLPDAEPSQQTPTSKFTIRIEICPADDVPSDAEELNAYEWAMAASIADAATRASHMHAQPDARDGKYVRTPHSVFGGGSTTTTTVPGGIATTLPSGMGRYSASRRGSEEGSPPDLKQVNRLHSFCALQTPLSERCMTEKSCERRMLQSVINSVDNKRQKRSAASPNSGSASGAVLDDDDFAHACRGSEEAGEDVDESNGNPFLLGALNGSPATTALNGDHSLVGSNKRTHAAQKASFEAKRVRFQETLRTPETLFFSPVSAASAVLGGSITKNRLNLERRELQSNTAVSNTSSHASVVSFPPAHDVRSGSRNSSTSVERRQLQSIIKSSSACNQNDCDARASSANCSNNDAVSVLSTPPPPSFVVRDGTPPNNTLTVSDLTTSALHASNSVNNPPPGVGGSSFSVGALTKPCLAIKSDGSPFLLGALCGSPATTAPNGDHTLVESGIFNQDLLNTVSSEAVPVTFCLQAITKLPLGVGGSGVSAFSSGSGGGVVSTITSRHSCTDVEPFNVKRRRLQHSHFPSVVIKVSSCDTVISEEPDLVSSTSALPPLRDDVPLSGTLATPDHAGFSPGYLNLHSLSPQERTRVEQHELQSNFPFNCHDKNRPAVIKSNIVHSRATTMFNGVDNQCLDSAANVLPVFPHPRTVAPLASIVNTVVERQSLQSSGNLLASHQHSASSSDAVVPDWGVSGNASLGLLKRDRTSGSAPSGTTFPNPELTRLFYPPDTR